MMDGRGVELSLMLLSSAGEQSAESSPDANAILRRKRKQTWEEAAAAAAATSAGVKTGHQLSTTTMASVDLQHHDPLPLDWEQCLDLQSGRMYYMNRKTLKKTWSKPREQKLDLELNICSPDHHSHHHHRNNQLITIPDINPSSPAAEDRPKRPPSSSSNPNSSTTNMVAVVCINCHLLVMLCGSSPSCPNCKHMNSLLLPAPAPPAAVEPPRTLSLLH